jgi:predicted O-methyltransferase YrrM
MDFDSIHEIVDGNGALLYELVLRERPARVLELGIGRGAATCYIAAALDEIGRGKLTAVDAVDAQRSAERLVAETRLDGFVDIVRMQPTWFLHDEIARSTRDDRCRAVYDLCIINGPEDWTSDCAAFFLVDKLLHNGGWVVTAHANDMFELLVKQHPSYTNLVKHGSWSLAQKLAAETKTVTVVHRHVLGYAYARMRSR